MLELNDFGNIKNLKELKKKEQNSKDVAKEIENFYQKKILELENEFNNILENTKKEYFLKGLKDGEKKKEEEYNKKIENLKNDLISQKEAEINSLKEKYQKIEIKLQNRLHSYIVDLTSILLDNIEEIFEFLYIKESNLNEIKNSIENTISEFKDSWPLEIKVSRKLYEEVADSFKNTKVVIDESLKDGDFIIEFFDFKIENIFKEKIKVLKDEIKRETKKFT